MAGDLDAILKLEVPLIVQISERSLTMEEVLALRPGAIIELPKPVGADLDILINNKSIGSGAVVKVGENFGIRVTGMGDLADRVKALGGDASRPRPKDPPDAPGPGMDPVDDEEAERIANEALSALGL